MQDVLLEHVKFLFYKESPQILRKNLMKFINQEKNETDVFSERWRLVKKQNEHKCVITQNVNSHDNGTSNMCQ